MADDDDILNPRRAPRVAVRCAVEIRQRLAVWDGETEDVGPGGCQIVTRRVVEPGTEVKLAIRCPIVQRTLAVTGKVIWARAAAPSRIGVSFEPPGTERGWFGSLLVSQPVAVRAARSVPDRLARTARLHLGRAPEVVVDFTPVELDILRRVGAGATVDALARSFGAELGGRTLGALFALLARRCLVLDPASSVDPETWRNVLGRQGDRPPAPDFARRALGANRSLEAQRLYDEALSHIGSGRLALAMERLRDALQHSPDDHAIASTAKRIERWASS